MLLFVMIFLLFKLSERITNYLNESFRTRLPSSTFETVDSSPQLLSLSPSTCSPSCFVD